MECFIKNPEEDSQLEKYVSVPIKMTIEDKMSWSMLASLLDGMTPTLKDCKQLIKILLKELQIAYKQKKAESLPEQIEMEETSNDVLNIVKDDSVSDIAENRNTDQEIEIQEMQVEAIPEEGDNEIEYNEQFSYDDTEIVEECSEFEQIEHLKANEELCTTEAYDLKDFYTFVGNNEGKEIQNKESEVKARENLRKPKVSKSDETNPNLNGHNGLSESNLDKKKKKELECCICLKTFSTKQKLERHGRIHTGEKPFKCKYCQKSFRKSDNLKCHERIHTGEVPYECMKCDKRFSRLFEKSSNNPHKGKIMKEKFTQSGSLNRHKKKHIKKLEENM